MKDIIKLSIIIVSIVDEIKNIIHKKTPATRST